MNGLIQELHTVISPQAVRSTSLAQPSPDFSVLHSPASPMKYEARRTSPETTWLLEDGNAIYTLTIHIAHSVRCTGSKVLEWMNACEFVFVHMVARGCVMCPFSDLCRGASPSD